MLVLDYRSKAKRTDWQILAAVLLFHAGLYGLWPVLKAGMNEEKIRAGNLIFLDLPAPAKPSMQQPEKKEAVKLATTQSSSSPLPVNERPGSATASTPEPVTPDIRIEMEAQSSPQPSAGINRDVGEIFKGLKKDFQERERFASKAVVDPITKMGERIGLSGTVNRVGVKHEVHILGDGRPVSKVITPFGTYCILHRKPGEIIGNELATVPVTCGNL
ncbi:hypothetical protein ACO0LM_05095 [Undibacterium sp. Di26W]|uniref:hypothetical protein n=1 Tax=Undibacterium sp. Di26W TaxID=3413035 RepID=UPI003BF1AA78